MSSDNIMVKLQKLANDNTAKTFKFNADEAATSRKWQKQMSDTSHQREVKDLQKAGLNPVLSANSGAQSYSTQSASAVADSAVNAIGNVESSRTSAAATRYAANQSLKASQTMANAQAYASQMAYAAQKYAADQAYASNKYAWDKKYKIEMNRPQGTIAGVLDKHLTGVFGKDNLDAFKRATSNGAKLFLNPSKDQWKGVVKTGEQAFKRLTTAGKTQLYQMVKRAGYQPDPKNMRQLALAIYTGNAIPIFWRKMNSAKGASKSLKSNPYRTGSGIW